jgi:hypothetical protein
MNDINIVSNPLPITITIPAYQTYTSAEVRYVDNASYTSNFKTQLENFLIDTTNMISSARKEMREKYPNLLS